MHKLYLASPPPSNTCTHRICLLLRDAMECMKTEQVLIYSEYLTIVSDVCGKSMVFMFCILSSIHTRLAIAMQCTSRIKFLVASGNVNVA